MKSGLKPFYPKFGFCYDLVNLNTSGEIEIWMPLDYMEAQVYITDKKLRTRNDIHVSSHWESEIILQDGWTQKYVVKVEELSNFDPVIPDDCKEYDNDDYDKCIDYELQKSYKLLFKCDPPWLSSENQCDHEMNDTKEITNSIWDS